MEATFIDSGKHRHYDGVLNDLNHLFHYCFVKPYREEESPFRRLLDIYRSTGLFEHWFYNKIIDGPVERKDEITARGVSHRITNWRTSQSTDTTDIIIYKERSEVIAWEPRLEYLVRTHLLKTMAAPVTDETINPVIGYDPYKWGYIDGRATHFGRFTGQKGIMSANSDPGYNMWQEITITVPGLDLSRLVHYKAGDDVRV